MVVPFGWRSIATTASCLDEDWRGNFAEVGLAAAPAPGPLGFDWALPLVLATPLRGDLRAILADVDFDLLVAIRLPLGMRQHQVLPLTQAREMVAGGGERIGRPYRPGLLRRHHSGDAPN